MKITSNSDTQIASEDAFPLLERGMKVRTPEGPGVITDIALHAARYGDRLELDPPIIKVKLDDPEANPQEIQVCMCLLGLGDKSKEMLISKEFSRLWPPIDEDIPEYTHQLVDVLPAGAEFIQNRQAKDKSMKKFLDRLNKQFPGNTITAGYQEDPIDRQEKAFLWRRARQESKKKARRKKFNG